MKRHSRFTAIILTAIIALTAGTACVYATEFSDAEPQQQESYNDPQPQESYNDPPQESYNDPQPQESYNDPDPQPQESYYDPPQESYEQPQQPQYYEPDDNDDGNNNNYNNNNNEVYYDSNGNKYDSPNEVYVGGNQTYTPPATTPSTTAALYDTSRSKIDDKTLSDGDWADIQSRLKSSNSSDGADGGDFAFIQNNSNADDNGHWMLILGFALILLSVAGFIYLIFMSANRRKEAAEAAGKGAAAATQKPSNGTRYRDEYDDDFGSESKKDKKEKKEKKAKSAKPKNGKRYK